MFYLGYGPAGRLRHRLGATDMLARIVGAEALVRRERPGVGMVPPQAFIHLAEENSFIVGNGTWMLQAACRQAVA